MAVPTTTDPRTPPIIEITTKSHTDSDGPLESSRAATPRNKDVDSVRTNAAETFCWRNVPRVNRGAKMPAWMPVPSRDPSAPKMFPRKPIAAGIRMIRPGSSSRRWRIDASASPATRLPVEATRSAV